MIRKILQANVFELVYSLYDYIASCNYYIAQLLCIVFVRKCLRQGTSLVTFIRAIRLFVLYCGQELNSILIAGVLYYRNVSLHRSKGYFKRWMYTLVDNVTNQKHSHCVGFLIAYMVAEYASPLQIKFKIVTLIKKCNFVFK